MPSGSAIEHRKPISSSSYRVSAPCEYGSAPSMSPRPRPLCFGQGQATSRCFRTGLQTNRGGQVRAPVSPLPKDQTRRLEAMSLAMFLRTKRERRTLPVLIGSIAMDGTGRLRSAATPRCGAARPFRFRRSIPAGAKHEAYCKAARIACELMPELPVFHTEIQEIRSLFPPADSEFHSALHACGNTVRRALSACSDSRKGSRHSSSLHDPRRRKGRHAP